ncbi:hypothetical protein B9G69_001160 [Bdellovibrio sp. SKB1291214]|uniref:hypothetical protein n=1 Tax=Bdellovibrio sp. SKB1291214 TaxID=1732569 RepID=UPI000B74967F|nr:hypothetical protein [Bdellovibrio sp. SKB1291214]UYL09184.1 hypothetical protein B9G69_001160 [Bdellovibrio sp. SKB1291214]
MRVLQVLLASLFIYSGSAVAAPGPTLSDALINDYSSSTQTQQSVRTPASSFQRPGILPCPDESRITKMNDLARLENHSRDCHPSTGGALQSQPNRPEGEVRGSEIPSQFE